MCSVRFEHTEKKFEPVYSVSRVYMITEGPYKNTVFSKSRHIFPAFQNSKYLFKNIISRKKQNPNHYK